MKKTNYFKETNVPLRDLVQINYNYVSSQSTAISPIASNRFNNQCSNQQKDIYDEFVYQDTMTNKKIKVRQAKTSYGVSRHAKNNSTYQRIQNQQSQKRKRDSRLKRHESAVINIEKQMLDLNQCYLMLKSTEMFKLNSLRQKLFGNQQKTSKTNNIKLSSKFNKFSQNQNKQNDMRRLILRKKKIRQIVQSTVNEASLNQFRNYYEDSQHRPNQKIINMARKLPKSINRHNIQKIVHNLQPQQNLTSQIIDKDPKLQQFTFEGQSKLKQEVVDFMKNQIKTNGQYLIKPPKDRLMYQKIFTNKKADKKISDLLKEIKLQNYQSACKKNQINNKKQSSQVSIPSKIQINTSRNIKDQKQNIEQKEQSIQQIFLNDHIKDNKRQICLKNNTFFSQFMSQFQFKTSSNKNSIGKVKATFLKNKKLTEQKLSLKEQKFLFLLQNGILFDVQKQILMNQDKLFFLDKNQNNILHISSKNRYLEIFTFTIQQLKKIDIKNRGQNKKTEVQNMLTAKNRNNKIPLDLAILYGAKQIVQIIQQLKLLYNIQN